MGRDCLTVLTVESFSLYSVSVALLSTYGRCLIVKSPSYRPITALAEQISDSAYFPSLTGEGTQTKQPHFLSQVRLQKVQP